MHLIQLRETERLILHGVKSLQKTVELLEAEGLTNGRPTFHGGKYLYMYYPNPEAKDGRDRIYVGIDPDKVRPVMEAVERSRQHARLLHRKQAALELLTKMRSSLERLHEEVVADIVTLGLVKDDHA